MRNTVCFNKVWLRFINVRTLFVFYPSFSICFFFSMEIQMKCIWCIRYCKHARLSCRTHIYIGFETMALHSLSKWKLHRYPSTVKYRTIYYEYVIVKNYYDYCQFFSSIEKLIFSLLNLFSRHSPCRLGAFLLFRAIHSAFLAIFHIESERNWNNMCGNEMKNALLMMKKKKRQKKNADDWLDLRKLMQKF